MRNILQKYRTLAWGTALGMAALIGTGTKASAQYNDDYNYNNGYNNGYNNNGYNQGGYQDDYYNNNGYNSYNNDYMAFYNDLAPHGQWFRDPQYGMVWCPRVGRDFAPYQTNGYWAMTQYGNTWMSNYSWGWAAFHYGRWTYDSYYGWLWIPGNEWGPAWVNWRSGGGYYGWAPLGPGISINMSFGFNAPMNWWTFVPMGNIYYTGGYGRYFNRGNVYNIYNNTTVINNYNNYGGRNYIVGPSRGDVERSVRRSVTVYNLSDRNGGGRSYVRGSNIEMYRPNVSNVVRSTNARSIDTRNVKAINRGDRANPGQGNNNGVRTPGNSNSYDRGNRPAPQPNNGGYQRRTDAPAPNRSVTPAPAPNRVMDNNNNRIDRSREVRMQQPQQQAPNRMMDNNNNRIDRSRDMRVQQPQQAPAPPRMSQPAPTRSYERAPQPMPQRQQPAPQRQASPAPQRQQFESRPAPSMQRSAPERSSGNSAPARGGGNMDRGFRR